MRIPLRDDFDGPGLRRPAKATKDSARIGGVTLQIIRDWVLRFNARGPDA